MCGRRFWRFWGRRSKKEEAGRIIPRPRFDGVRMRQKAMCITLTMKLRIVPATLPKRFARFSGPRKRLLQARTSIKQSQLRDRGHEKGRELSAISLPPWLRRNIEQAAGLTTAFKFPCLDTLDALHDNAGEPDAKVLSVLPNPLLPPVRFVVANIPHFSVSTLKAVLPLDDIGSPFFQALLPLISPESIARFKSGHEELVRSAFNEVERAADATRGRPLLLCVVRPTARSLKMFRENYSRASVEPTANLSYSRNSARYRRSWDSCRLRQSYWEYDDVIQRKTEPETRPCQSVN